MVGLSYATVPLYKIFCAATGYGGTVNGAKTVESKMKKRLENPNEKVEKGVPLSHGGVSALTLLFCVQGRRAAGGDGLVQR